MCFFGIDYKYLFINEKCMYINYPDKDSKLDKTRNRLYLLAFINFSFSKEKSVVV